MDARPASPRRPLLAQRPARLAGTGLAVDYADALLRDLGAAVERRDGPPARPPALAWAESGAMALTGRTEGPPLMSPAPLAACADGVLRALAALGGGLDGLDGAALLGERAALAGLSRAGAVSPGGACRLLAAADGRLALNLARPDDWDLLPAWLEQPASSWDAVAAAVQRQPAAALVARAREMGLAAAPARPRPPPAAWLQGGPAAGGRVSPGRAPLVVDLSGLWAGPLCGQLLHRLGARVVKVESVRRPDGARAGPAAFYDRLNAGKASVALDLATPAGRASLAGLLRAADIVIEAARPRALAQLGLDAAALLAERPGLTWISLTGYGRAPPEGDWIAFGDDAGVAAGLSGLLARAAGDWLFCADAVADPLTGLHAALAAWAGWLAGGGGLVALALADVAAHCAGFGLPAGDDGVRARWQDWTALAQGHVRPPTAPPPGPAARPLGADTAAVLADLVPSC
jgi:hypothetical protein